MYLADVFCHLKLWWTCRALSFPTLALSLCEFGLMGLRFFGCFSVQLKLHFGYALKTLFKAKAGFGSEKLEWTWLCSCFPYRLSLWAFRAICSSSPPSLSSQVLLPKPPPSNPKLNLESHADRVCGKKFVKKVENCLLSPWGKDCMGREEKIIYWDTAWFSQAGQNCIRHVEAAVLSQPRGNGVSAVFIRASNQLQLPWLEALGFCPVAAGKWAWQWLTGEGRFWCPCSRVLTSSSAAAERPSRDFCDLTAGIAFRREAN